jgi:hypothetical protein
MEFSAEMLERGRAMWAEMAPQCANGPLPPRLATIPAAAAVGANPVPPLSTLPALGQYLPSFGEGR